MIKLGLCCLLHDHSEFGYRSCTLSHRPDALKLRHLYTHNLLTVLDYVDYCAAAGIYSYRIPCSIFPLATLPQYSKTARHILEGNTAQHLFAKIRRRGTHLTTHPDQYILLSSSRPEVNDRSVRELNFWGYIGAQMGLKCINIHMGSKAEGGVVHTALLARNLQRLNPTARALLSLENCEKSYSVQEVLEFCQRFDVKMCLDLHHNRIHQIVKHGKSAAEADDLAHQLLPDIARTWQTLPVMHISSPKCGHYAGSLRDMCSHADYIAHADVPRWLSAVNAVLEVEAKHKQLAVSRLTTHLYKGLT